jgi:multidrug efflux pump subunit AcrB
MIKFLITRPIAVIMTFIALIVLGLVAYHSVPVSLMPDIPIPEITVNISYKNSSARELENAIVKPLRVSLMQVAHLDEIKSETRNGLAVIKLRFDYGTNVDYSYIEVNEKVDGAMNYLPRDMDRPKVIKASATDIPVFYLNLSLKDNDSLTESNSNKISDRFIELSGFAETVIRKRVEQLPEVAMVDISGIVKPQVIIEPDLEKMRAMNISISQLESAISENNINPGSLTINDGHYQYNIRFNSVLRTAADVENIYLKISERVLQLKDIARVSIGVQKRNGMYASNGKPAIAMAVIKQADAKLADMKDKIKELVSTFEKDYPGIHFEASQDQTELLDYSIANLKQNLSQGLLLVIIVVFLFLKDFKSPLLIGLTLMVSMVACMLFFKLIGLSINIISLAGLILAVGNMIDNSIVVTDNISQYKDRGLTIENACIKGTNEVMMPMLSSMLTNVAVFVPMIFLSGIAGALMYDEAMSVVIGLGVSYIVGITLMPVIYNLGYGFTRKSSNKVQSAKDKLFLFISKRLKPIFDLEKVYKRVLDFTFRRKKLNLVLYLSSIPIGLLFLVLIKKEKMPEFPQTEVIIKIDWNENIHVDENKKRVISILELLKQKTEQSNCYIGQQQFLMNYEEQMSASESKIYIKTGKTENINWINNSVKSWFQKNYPKAKLSFELPMSIFEKIFTSNESPLVAEISLINKGTDWDLGELLKLQRNLKTCPTFGGSKKQLKLGNDIPLQDNIILTVDMERLLLYNVSYDALLKELKTAFKENYVGTLKSFQQYLPIVISGQETYLAEILEHLEVFNEKKELVPVKLFIKTELMQDLKTITAGKEGEFIPLAYEPDRKEKDLFIQEINTTIKQSGIFNVNYSGSIFTSNKLLKEMGIILMISILLLYFILAAQFESLVQPLLVLLEIPIDFAGALLFLYIAGESLNLMSAIGMVIMTGIIINDSILKLDVINQLRSEGYPILEAIKEGGHRRLRAILMTSLTSVLAMMPLLFSSDLGSELQKPFSYALIGGMIVGTLVSLFFVPLVYWWIYREKEINNK